MKRDQNRDKERWNQEAAVFLRFYKKKISWTWFLNFKTKISFKYFTKCTSKSHNNTLKTNTVTVRNFIKAVTKIRTCKNSPPLKHLIFNSMKLSKGSEKTQKNKSSSKWNKSQILCLKKLNKIKKPLLKNLSKSIFSIMKSTVMKKHGNN